MRGDDDLQIEYIRAVIEENFNNPSAIILCITAVAEARGSKNFLDSEKLNFENIYELRLEGEDRRLNTFIKILEALNLSLPVQNPK
jgi:DNA-binding phage protein